MSKYNGWTNYDTWLIALWIDNEPYTYETRCEMAQDCLESDNDPGDYSGDPGRAPVFELAKRLESWIDDPDGPFGPMPESGPWADMINTGLSKVNWYEIAENYINEAREND